MILLAPAVAEAQLGSVPYTFTPGTTILSSQVNANFSTAYALALNRDGGTMTGTLTTEILIPGTDATYDVGSGSFRYRDGFFSRNMTIVGTLTLGDLVADDLTVDDVTIDVLTLTTLTCTDCVGATQLAPLTLTATYFSDLSGANLTSIPETAITDGTLLARLAANETITGSWVYSIPTGVSATVPYLFLLESDQGSGLKRWHLSADAQVFSVLAADDGGTPTGSLMTIGRTGNVSVGGTLATLGTVSTSATIPIDCWIESDQASGSQTWVLYAETQVLTLGINTAGNTCSNNTTLWSITRASGALKLETATGTVTERGRSFAMGATQTRAYSAGNFAGGAGLTWTVDSGDVHGESWRVVGDTLIYNLDIATSTVSGTGTTLNVTLPGSFTAAETMRFPCTYSDGTNVYVPVAQTTASSATLAILHLTGGNHVTGTNIIYLVCTVQVKVS